ncbi:MAG: malate synthase A [Actinomycetota bacterium]|nr:malate synthase A [Actinomycetota bacterium]
MKTARHFSLMNQFRQSETERKVLTEDAVAFLIDLENEFGWRRGQLLAQREVRQESIDGGELPSFLSETREIREGDWTIAPVPADLQDRRVEITGPVDRKMMINALNSGAKVFMADFEDATSPTWENLLEGHLNLVEAYQGVLELKTDQKHYTLNDEVATLVVRPRGWHLVEKHFEVDGCPMSASLFDLGLYMFHGGRAAIENGSGPYVYLPKLESHHEARLWNDVFVWVQHRLGMPLGTIKATVLIENVLAAFEMNEILYEIRAHAAGLNAGRWDYIFSVIKKFRDNPDFVLPDRGQVTMTVPFMHAYTELMVKTCHSRGAHAIGGMAAFIPNRRDPEVTERAIAAVSADKAREAGAGCDGTWVAHPDLVAVAKKQFDDVLGEAPNQVSRQRDDVSIGASDLLDVDFPGSVTMDGVRVNVSVGIQYLASWIAGTGAAAINNLMEDVATAEISRSQIWQWVRHGITTADGVPVTEALIRSMAGDVVAQLEGAGHPLTEHLHVARKVFEEVALSETFVDFLTLSAYELIS